MICSPAAIRATVRSSTESSLNLPNDTLRDLSLFYIFVLKRSLTILATWERLEVASSYSPNQPYENQSDNVQRSHHIKYLMIRATNSV